LKGNDATSHFSLDPKIGVERTPTHLDAPRPGPFASMVKANNPSKMPTAILSIRHAIPGFLVLWALSCAPLNPMRHSSRANATPLPDLYSDIIRHENVPFNENDGLEFVIRLGVSEGFSYDFWRSYDELARKVGKDQARERLMDLVRAQGIASVIIAKPGKKRIDEQYLTQLLTRDPRKSTWYFNFIAQKPARWSRIRNYRDNGIVEYSGRDGHHQYPTFLESDPTR
jgi:hypothetical protein